MAQLLAEWVNELRLFEPDNNSNEGNADYDENDPYMFQYNDEEQFNDDDDSDSDLERSGEEARNEYFREEPMKQAPRYTRSEARGFARPELQQESILVNENDLQHMFASGYMVGKLLNKFNQQTDFNQVRR